jgi:phage baseplate assembly protein gpV
MASQVLDTPSSGSSGLEADMAGAEKTSKAAPASVAPKLVTEFPDGGLVAWTQVAMGHLVIFNCWGYITSYVLCPRRRRVDTDP